MGVEKKNKVETGRWCRYGSPRKRGKVAGVKFVAVEVREDELKLRENCTTQYFIGKGLRQGEESRMTPKFLAWVTKKMMSPLTEEGNDWKESFMGKEDGAFLVSCLK